MDKYTKGNMGVVAYSYVDKSRELKHSLKYFTLESKGTHRHNDPLDPITDVKQKQDLFRRLWFRLLKTVPSKENSTWREGTLNLSEEKNLPAT